VREVHKPELPQNKSQALQSTRKPNAAILLVPYRFVLPLKLK
jgi:hypothetical protein